MDVKILEERANPLLHRKEYTFEVDHAGAATPPRGEVRKELAKLVNVPADRLVIERMNARFGTAKTRGEAMAYATKEAVDVTVREHILIRNGLREKAVPVAPAAGGEAAAPAAPAEPPKPAAPKSEPAPTEPSKEHPKAEHPKGEHPKAEPHKTEPHKAEAPKETHKGESHKPEAAKEAHKGEGHKSEKADKPEKSEKTDKGEKAEKHEGKAKPAHEPKKES